ncbi:class I SAM-dependent methyltransferase [Microlunatus soli]|uniref:Methyltransferase domain-containing protein n=1 Tax=Microlunatus soli TaxID=630515 RepID=A0A1H1UT56_9ACTN|nr:class I SAM-dependent methyltransferase [Microlunatus soli]SDS75039.1 Methyltransferase domain-containing protein [Microlunatus soli]
MPTLPSPPASHDPHRARQMAESFGTDAARYDRARPSYPAALIRRIVDTAPGPDLLDVGCGTGIAGRQFVDAGCTVLGVEPDARMAAFAGAGRLPVEVATFEDWDPAGRRFDAVTAAQSWHWIDPVAGPAKAAEVLRPDGVLAIFGHVFEPPDPIAEAFTDAYTQAVPDSPFDRQSGRRPVQLYQSMYAAIADRIRESGRFAEPEQWRHDWQCSYTREQWLELLPTTGGLTQLGPDQLDAILTAVGRAVDEVGGSFTMEYTTLAVTAARRPHR